jgi:hypothetical protein
LISPFLVTHVAIVRPLLVAPHPVIAHTLILRATVVRHCGRTADGLLLRLLFFIILVTLPPHLM